MTVPIIKGLSLLGKRKPDTRYFLLLALLCTIEVFWIVSIFICGTC